MELAGSRPEVLMDNDDDMVRALREYLGLNYAPSSLLFLTA